MIRKVGMAAIVAAGLGWSGAAGGVLLFDGV